MNASNRKMNLRKLVSCLVILLMVFIPSTVLYSQVNSQKINVQQGYFKDKTVTINDQKISANFYVHWNSYIKLVDLLKALSDYTCKVYQNYVNLYQNTGTQQILKAQFSIGDLTSYDGFNYNGRLYLDWLTVEETLGLQLQSNTDRVPDELSPVGYYEGRCGTIEIDPEYQLIDLSQYIEGWPMQQARMAKLDILYKGQKIKGTYPIAPAFEGYVINPNILYIYTEKGKIDYYVNVLEYGDTLKMEFATQGDHEGSEVLIKQNK